MKKVVEQVTKGNAVASPANRSKSSFLHQFRYPLRDRGLAHLRKSQSIPT
jgi:hypothetical protein